MEIMRKRGLPPKIKKKMETWHKELFKGRKP
jgi:hypothetical protein